MFTIVTVSRRSTLMFCSEKLTDLPRVYIAAQRLRSQMGHTEEKSSCVSTICCISQDQPGQPAVNFPWQTETNEKQPNFILISICAHFPEEAMTQQNGTCHTLSLFSVYFMLKFYSASGQYDR